MERIKQFFWLCSGADLATLKRTPTEANKFIGIGGTIFFTALLAFFSAGYAIYTIFDNYFAAFVFGLVWALMIFNLDRYIVGTMKNKDNFFSDFLVASPRIIMAIFLAIVISKPLELKIFEKEINAELVGMAQEVKQTQEEKVKARFTPTLLAYQAEIDGLKNENANKAAQRDALLGEALKEADGTGGSGKRNMGPIYQAKLQAAAKAEREYQMLLDKNGGYINERVTAYNALLAQQQATIAALPDDAYNGFAARIEALGRLTQRSEVVAMANFFIMLLFIIIETAPVFVKLISNRSPYDYKLDAHEHVFAMQHKERTGMQFEAVKNNLKFYTETGAFRVRAEIDAEKELISNSIRERLEKLRDQDTNWKQARKGFL